MFFFFLKKCLKKKQKRLCDVKYAVNANCNAVMMNRVFIKSKKKSLRTNTNCRCNIHINVLCRRAWWCSSRLDHRATGPCHVVLETYNIYIVVTYMYKTVAKHDKSMHSFCLLFRVVEFQCVRLTIYRQKRRTLFSNFERLQTWRDKSWFIYFFNFLPMLAKTKYLMNFWHVMKFKSELHTKNITNN